MLTDIIEDAINLSVREFEARHDQTLHNGRIHIFIDWVNAQTSLDVTVEDATWTVFTASTDLYATITDQIEAIRAIKEAVEIFCNVVHTPAEHSFPDELQGNVNNDIDQLRYEMEYNTETGEMRNVYR
jgi:hypothetical protein